MKSFKIIEWIAIGGVSLFAWPFVQFFDIDRLPSLPILILLFSLPHFALSYFLFYSQKGLAREHKFAAYIAPAFLIIGMLILAGTPTRMNYFVQAGYFFFFHHIGKQAYGVSLFYSGAPTKYSKFWKYAIFTATLAWAWTTWLDQQSKDGMFMAFKSYVHTLDIAPIYARAGRWFAIAATGVALIAWIRHARSALPSTILMSWTPILALIVWCTPALGLTPLGLMPVMHGLQYAPFALKKLSREGWRFGLASVVILAALPIGYLLFQGSTTYLMTTSPSARTETIVAMIYIFLNVHHYVLDRYMWRRKTFYERRAPVQAEATAVIESAA